MYAQNLSIKFFIFIWYNLMWADVAVSLKNEYMKLKTEMITVFITVKVLWLYYWRLKDTIKWRLKWIKSFCKEHVVCWYLPTSLKRKKRCKHWYDPVVEITTWAQENFWNPLSVIKVLSRYSERLPPSLKRSSSKMDRSEQWWSGVAIVVHGMTNMHICKRHH